MPIIDSSGKVIGIISERDIARKIHQENFSNNELVTNIMTKKIISCDLNISVTELMETMTEKKIRHMLIMNNDELKCIVSIGDVVNHLIENYKEENKNLKLRVAAMRKEGDNFQYAIGFDDNVTQNDRILNIDEIEIVISNISLELCDGMTIDYVELEKNKFNFIFLNPKDPNYVKPKE